jgi:hypothetical protein
MITVAVVCVCGTAGERVGTVAGIRVPFQRGVNLTNWLQAGSARQIQFTRFTKQDLINIKSLGCDVIRLPIKLRNLVERGSWDGAWFPPQGVFDWSAVDRFEIVSEYHDFVGMQFWFDDLRVSSPSGVR